MDRFEQQPIKLSNFNRYFGLFWATHEKAFQATLTGIYTPVEVALENWRKNARAVAWASAEAMFPAWRPFNADTWGVIRETYSAQHLDNCRRDLDLRTWASWYLRHGTE